ncbi:MAG: GAF domain-containing protein [Anaerolineales bacterium]
MRDGNAPITERELQQLSQRVSQLSQRLRRQRAELRQHGMDVPAGTLKGLESVHVDLENTAPLITEQYNELERLRILAETTSLVNSSLDVKEVLSAVMETVLKLTGAERGYILLRDEQSGEMQARVSVNITRADEETDEFAVSRTIINQVAENGEPIVTANALMDDVYAAQPSVVMHNLRSILCVPLIIKGTVEGVIYVDNRINEGIFSNKELQLLYAIASQSSLAIENAKLFEQARAALEEITAFKSLLDNILASIASGVITTDTDIIITTYNVGAETILGIPRTLTEGRPFHEAVQFLYEAVHDVLPSVFSNGQALTLERDIVAPTEELRNLNLKLSPLKDAAEQTQGVALVVDDLTDLKRRDATLAAVNRYLPPMMVENIQSIEGIGLGGERRLVTVLFVDVRPFYMFPTELEAGAVMEQLNLHLTIATEAVHRRLGLIDKYMGSEVMALYNTQLNPSANHALDALLSALDMIQEFHRKHSELSIGPDEAYYRIGIHTGIATMGNVGGTQRREFTAIGDTVNLAKRLQENAAPGELIISQNTYAECAAYMRNNAAFAVIPREPMRVKGRSQLTEIFEVRFDPKTVRI